MNDGGGGGVALNHLPLLFCKSEDPKDKDKIRSNSSKRCRRRYILSEDYFIATNFPKGLPKILLGTPIVV